MTHLHRIWHIIHFCDMSHTIDTFDIWHIHFWTHSLLTQFNLHVTYLTSNTYDILHTFDTHNYITSVTTLKLHFHFWHSINSHIHSLNWHTIYMYACTQYHICHYIYMYAHMSHTFNSHTIHSTHTLYICMHTCHIAYNSLNTYTIYIYDIHIWTHMSTHLNTLSLLTFWHVALLLRAFNYTFGHIWTILLHLSYVNWILSEFSLNLANSHSMCIIYVIWKCIILDSQPTALVVRTLSKSEIVQIMSPLLS